MDLLRKNYRLSLWLARLVFIVCYVFGNWFELKSYAQVSDSIIGVGVSVYGTFWYVALFGTLSAIISLVIIRLISMWILRYTRLMYLPPNEVTLFVVVFAALKELIVGVLSLSYLITPLAVGWGSIVFDFVGLIAAAISFYAFMYKHYLPEGNKALVFRLVVTLTSVFGIITLLMGVFAL